MNKLQQFSLVFIQLFVAYKVSLFMYVLRRETVNIVNSTGLFNCYIGWSSCSGWRLEESCIHDLDTKTATISEISIEGSSVDDNAEEDCTLS